MAWVLHRFRPPVDEYRWVELYRMTEDWTFVLDDLQPGIAFAGKAYPKGSLNWFPFAVGYQLRDGTNEAPFWVTDMADNDFWQAHPNSIAKNAATEFVLRKYGGACNGLSVK